MLFSFAGRSCPFLFDLYARLGYAFRHSTPQNVAKLPTTWTISDSKSINKILPICPTNNETWHRDPANAHLYSPDRFIHHAVQIPTTLTYSDFRYHESVNRPKPGDSRKDLIIFVDDAAGRSYRKVLDLKKKGLERHGLPCVHWEADGADRTAGVGEGRRGGVLHIYFSISDGLVPNSRAVPRRRWMDLVRAYARDAWRSFGW